MFLTPSRLLLLGALLAAGLVGCGGGSSTLPAASADARLRKPTPSPSPAATAAPLLTGTVADIASYGFDTCPPPGGTIYQGYGCIPVTIAPGATVVGTAQVGASFQVWGSVSVPNVTATTVIFTPPGASATPSPAPTATPLLSGTVADIASYGFDTCPPPGGFIYQDYGCIPVTIAPGATIVGTDQVGATFQLWGSVVIPNVTATKVIFTPPGGTASPAPNPSASPTAPPPTAPAGSTFQNLTNATDIIGFVPFAGNSPFNTKVSAHPTYLANSAAIISAQFGGSIGPMRSNEAGQYDNMHARYYATSSDPLINLVCTQYCPRSVPATMHIPAKARPPGGGDAQIAVIQPDGTEIDTWATYGFPGSPQMANDMQTRNWQSGDTLSAGNVTTCGNVATSLGLVPDTGSTAPNFCLSAGIVTAQELASGQINHAVFVSGQCAIGSQYPSTGFTQQCTSGVGPPLGGRLWYDVPDSVTNASALQPWEKAVLNAEHDYGAYFGDNGSGGAYYTGGIQPFTESEEPWRAYNGTGTNNSSYTSPFAVLAAQGWTVISVPNAIGGASGNRWIANGGADWTPWATLGESEAAFASHFHWLAPCSAQGTC